MVGDTGGAEDLGAVVASTEDIAAVSRVVVVGVVLAVARLWLGKLRLWG